MRKYGTFLNQIHHVSYPSRGFKIQAFYTPWASTTIKIMVDPIPMIKTLRKAKVVILTSIVLMVVGISGYWYRFNSTPKSPNILELRKSKSEFERCFSEWKFILGPGPVKISRVKSPMENGGDYSGGPSGHQASLASRSPPPKLGIRKGGFLTACHAGPVGGGNFGEKKPRKLTCFFWGGNL